MDSAVDRLVTLKVKDVMSRNVICVSVDQSISEAAAAFVDRQISGAPVVDAQHQCVGILSATDFVDRLRSSEDVNPTSRDELCVRDLMSPGVRALQPEQTLLMAARIMCVKHVHRLPVLDGDNRPVGLVTAMDVVAALVNAIDEREAAEM